MGCADAEVIPEMVQRSDGRWEVGVEQAVRVARDGVSAEEEVKEASEPVRIQSWGALGGKVVVPTQ